MIEYTKKDSIVSTLKAINLGINDIYEFFLVADNDIIILSEVFNEVKALEFTFFKFEKKCYFFKKNDKCNTFLDIQAGSGGVDAQDWANMLFNMYSFWANRNKFKFEVLSLSLEDIGLKHVSVKIIGEYSFGWLKYENGIHRLVRKSPFNSGNKRHTSFASVFVYPDNDKSLDLVINDYDLQIDTFRSSGAGGQHVNKTDSAVRIKHIPTNTVVKCQANRSQHKNKAQALKQLRAKLYELESSKKLLNRKEVEKNKSSISWGNQIRSYVLDQSRIKDLRTNIEVNDVQRVLNGYLEPFMFSLLNKKI